MAAASLAIDPFALTRYVSTRGLTIVGGAVTLGSLAAGAGRQYAPAAPIWRLRAAPQLHR
jgi:hypothetical protein